MNGPLGFGADLDIAFEHRIVPMMTSLAAARTTRSDRGSRRVWRLEGQTVRRRLALARTTAAHAWRGGQDEPCTRLHRPGASPPPRRCRAERMGRRDRPLARRTDGTNATRPTPVDTSRLLRSPRRRPDGRTAAAETALTGMAPLLPHVYHEQLRAERTAMRCASVSPQGGGL
jgi:hypothetical protein